MIIPLYNLKTIRNISMKLGTLIKHDEMMCHAKEPYFPLIIFHSILCLLYNSKTIRDFLMKHGTLIKHDAQESLLLLSYLWSYFPLIIFQTLSCPLYNLKTVRDVSMKLGTLIKQNDRICDAQEL